jgi:class 3 adenylate cyclase
MDAVGSERAALFGVSEGGPMSLLFAATHPERVSALVVHGAMGRTTEAPDYPWASPAQALREAGAELIVPTWGQDGETVLELFAPSFARNSDAAAFTARMQRSSASPSMVQQIFEMFLDIDVRAILPTIHVPTLVVHRHGDRVVNRRAGQELADRIPGARYVELPGDDHLPWAGDPEAILGEVEEFLTGVRTVPEPDRVLATVMFTDVVGSTELAAELGDRRWNAVIASYYDVARREVRRFHGREIDTAGDGFFAAFDAPNDGVRAATAIVESMWAKGVPIRAGLHAGECEVVGKKVGGIAVHIGARVAAEAAPGEVRVSQTVKDLVAGSGITFADCGTTELKGVPGEWRLFAVADT